MFPLSLINASVTDAGRIRSRLGSFPLRFCFPLCATLPFRRSFILTGLLVYPSSVATFFFLHFLLLGFRRCTDSRASRTSNCNAPLVWRACFHSPLLLLPSVTHYFTFINLTHQPCRLHRNRMQEVTFFFSFLHVC